MGRPRDTGRKTEQVSADSNLYRTVLLGPWMLMYGGATLRVTNEFRQMSGNYRQIARFRGALVSPDFPEAWTDSANVRSTNGIGCEDFTPGAGAIWVQTALAGSVSTGSMGEAMAALQAMTKDLGELVVSQTIQLEPDLNSLQTGIIPLGEPFPTLGLAGAILGVNLTGVGGTADYQAAIRYMDRTDEPGAWSTIGNQVTGITGNDRRNTADIPITPPSSPPKMFAQLGLQYTAAFRVTAQVIGAIRRA